MFGTRRDNQYADAQMRRSKPVPGFRARLVSRAAESNKGVSHDGFMALRRANCSSGTSAAAAAALALGEGETAGVGVGVGTGFPSSPSTVLFRSSFYFINPRITETTEADGRSNGRARTLELSPLHRGQLGRCCSRVEGRWHVAAGNAIPSTSLDFMTRSLLQPQSLAASSPSFRLRHRYVGLAKAISQASDLNPHTLYPPPLLPFLGLQTLIRFDFDLTVSSLRSFLGLV
eukprot:CAMPEP_0119543786 /NCGR_PEP_ID=MMETSP1344-20130328/54345_1 /TAXON_ID=236787 /ORGANISM="Florenciella parvula, Strain CCMP2471" /LENGTH=230 /DNA_ID=CAMNT_0007588173 /DNA_START=131 /DNA_END=825 /DNA_ORIENTATION=-